MDHGIIWAVIGLVLVIVELLTGTFYLLMLGLAAFGAAPPRWLGFAFASQSIVAALVAAVGCYAVHAYRAKNKAQQMAPIDAGMPASFESWGSEGRLAKVRYRGASWDARGGVRGRNRARATVYVLATDGNTLRVAKIARHKRERRQMFGKLAVATRRRSPHRLFRRCPSTGSGSWRSA